MDINNKGTKELAKVYHDIEGLGSYIECIKDIVDDNTLIKYLSTVNNLLNQCKSHMIETVVKDVMGAYANDKYRNNLVQDISLDEALRLAEKIKNKAAQQNISVVVAVYNSAARPVVVQCMDNSYIASYDVATSKAFTSAALKMSTIELKALSQPGQSLYGIENTNEGKINIIGGGEPLIVEGKIIGSIGVSGNTEEVDTALAAYGKEIIKEVIAWQ